MAPRLFTLIVSVFVAATGCMAASVPSVCDGLTDSEGRRVRKEWRELTADQQANYLNALKELYKNGKWDAVKRAHWDEAVVDFAHEDYFLAWHRSFVLRYENQLRSLGPQFSCLTIPYWDWTMDIAPPGSSVAASINFMRSLEVVMETGGIGRAKDCVVRTIVGDVQYGEQPMCVTRVPHRDGWRPSGPIEMADIIGNAPEFPDFSNRLKWAHSFVHVAIGGTMQDFRYSPNDPLFMMHHAFIDKMFAAWQACNPGKIPDTVPPAPNHYDRPMPGFRDAVTPRQMTDWLSLGYTYAADVLDETTYSTLLASCKGQIPWLKKATVPQQIKIEEPKTTTTTTTTTTTANIIATTPTKTVAAPATLTPTTTTTTVATGTAATIPPLDPRNIKESLEERVNAINEKLKLIRERKRPPLPLLPILRWNNPSFPVPPVSPAAGRKPSIFETMFANMRQGFGLPGPAAPTNPQPAGGPPVAAQNPPNVQPGYQTPLTALITDQNPPVPLPAKINTQSQQPGYAPPLPIVQQNVGGYVPPLPMKMLPENQQLGDKVPEATPPNLPSVSSYAGANSKPPLPAANPPAQQPGYDSTPPTTKISPQAQQLGYLAPLPPPSSPSDANIKPILPAINPPAQQVGASPANSAAANANVDIVAENALGMFVDGVNSDIANIPAFKNQILNVGLSVAKQAECKALGPPPEVPLKTQEHFGLKPLKFKCKKQILGYS